MQIPAGADEGVICHTGSVSAASDRTPLVVHDWEHTNPKEPAMYLFNRHYRFTTPGVIANMSNEIDMEVLDGARRVIRNG